MSSWKSTNPSRRINKDEKQTEWRCRKWRQNQNGQITDSNTTNKSRIEGRTVTTAGGHT